MEKAEGIILLIVFLMLFAVTWYFIFRNPNCEPITRCYLDSLNRTCSSDNDCSSNSITGNCNRDLFRCVNLILDTDKPGCVAAGGRWYEKGCGWEREGNKA
jgi:hypothetical protein